MAYKSWSRGQTNVGGLTAFLTGNGPIGFDGLEPMMLNMGWTLVDGSFVSANDFAVFKSNGEDSNKPYGYIHIWKDIAGNRLRFQAYMDWNASTHVGIQGTGYYGSVAISTGDFPVWIWGDKDIVVLKTNVSSYSTGLFGHVPSRWAHCSLVTKTTDAIVAGSSVSIPVISSVGFEVGKSYQIVGVSQEGQDYVMVSATTATTITVSTLNKNFASGAYIGVLPLAFFNTKDSSHKEICWVHYTGATGDTATDNYWDLGWDQMVSVADSDPDGRSGTYPLQALTFGDRGVNDAHQGFTIGRTLSKFMRIPISGGISNDDVVYLGRSDFGTSTGSNTTSTLNDTGKTWVSGAHTNKMVVVVNGTGYGQSRLISGNTATQLSVSPNWSTTPDATSEYVVCDSVYRISSIAGLTGCYLATKDDDPGWQEPSRIEISNGPYDWSDAACTQLGTSLVYGTAYNRWETYAGPVWMFTESGGTAYFAAYLASSLVQMTKRGGAYEFYVDSGEYSEKAMFCFIFGADSTIFSDFGTATFYTMSIVYVDSVWKVMLHSWVGSTSTLIASSGSVSSAIGNLWKFSREGSTFRAYSAGTLVFQYSDNTIAPSDTRIYCGYGRNTTDGGAFTGSRIRLKVAFRTYKYVTAGTTEYTLAFEDTITGKTGGVPDAVNFSGSWIYETNTMTHSNGAGAMLYASESVVKLASRGGRVDMTVGTTDGTFRIFLLYASGAFSNFAGTNGYMVEFPGNWNVNLKYGTQANGWSTTIGTYALGPYVVSSALDLRICLDYNTFTIYAGTNFATKVTSFGLRRLEVAANSCIYLGFGSANNNTKPTVTNRTPFRIWSRVA